MRNFAPHKIEGYVDCVAYFARHHGKNPGVLRAEQMRQYLLHLVEKTAWGSCVHSLVPAVFACGSSSAMTS